jgi:hypothetical protein
MAVSFLGPAPVSRRSERARPLAVREETEMPRTDAPISSSAMRTIQLRLGASSSASSSSPPRKYGVVPGAT